MTKTIAIIACLFWPFAATFAQSNHLKLYLGFELANRTELQLSSNQSPKTSYSQAYSTIPFYALAFSHLKANGNFWEISGQTNAYAGYKKEYDFSNLDTLPTAPFVSIGTSKNSYAQLQFEYNWLQGAADDRKVKPYLGLFLRASGQRLSFRPASAEFWPLEKWRTLISPGFVPRILLRAGSRVQLDLSAPIVLGHFSLEHTTLENPALTYRQQRNSSFDLSMLDLETQIRLGVTYRLNKPGSQIKSSGL